MRHAVGLAHQPGDANQHVNKKATKMLALRSTPHVYK